LKLVDGLVLKEDKKGNKASSKLIGAHIKKQDYNETTLATIAIVSDDGPMCPKHVVLV
jgi:hypothetical protein